MVKKNNRLRSACFCGLCSPKPCDIDESSMGWHNLWIKIANRISEQSYDPRLKVGAIIVPDDNSAIYSLGYNGNARGLPNRVESKKPGQSGFIHAELNALLKLDYRAVGKKTMYVTHAPCRMCVKYMIQCKISRVVFDNLYRDMSGIELLKQADIEVFRLYCLRGYAGEPEIPFG